MSSSCSSPFFTSCYQLPLLRLSQQCHGVIPWANLLLKHCQKLSFQDVSTIFNKVNAMNINACFNYWLTLQMLLSLNPLLKHVEKLWPVSWRKLNQPFHRNSWAEWEGCFNGLRGCRKGAELIQFLTPSVSLENNKLTAFHLFIICSEETNPPKRFCRWSTFPG